MCTPLPRSRSTHVGTRFSYTQTAATEGMFASPGSGRIAFEQSAATLPGVSEPSSVVRSMQRIASSSAKTFASFLIERFASDAERSSSATASIDPIRGSRGSSGSSNPTGSAGAWAMSVSVDRPLTVTVTVHGFVTTCGVNRMVAPSPAARDRDGLVNGDSHC